jgi:DNA repair protein RecO (recombination protein O)
MAKIVKTQAIALAQVKYSETSIIAQAYTLHFGRQAYMVHGARKPKAKLKASLFAPFTIIEIEQSRTENGGLQLIKEAWPILPQHSIRQDISKSATAMFLSEVLLYALRDESPNATLFSFLCNAAELLEQLENGASNFHLVFLAELSKYLGFYPNLNYCSTLSPYFDMECGVFAPAMGRSSLGAAPSRMINAVFSTGMTKLHTLSISGAERSECLRYILDFYRQHIPNMPTIRSLDILSDMFA